MARTRRKRGKTGGNQSIVFIFIAVALVVVGAILFKVGKTETAEKGSNFSATEYMQRGSTSVGNVYTIPATVAEVNSHGGSRIIEVLTQDNKRIGLFVPPGAVLKANVRAGMDYVFTVQGRNGQMPDGSPVKGILVVTEAEAK